MTQVSSHEPHDSNNTIDSSFAQGLEFEGKDAADEVGKYTAFDLSNAPYWHGVYIIEDDAGL